MKLLYNFKTKQWLRIMSMIFNERGKATKVTAKKIGSDVIKDGLFTFREEELKDIGMNFDIKSGPEIPLQAINKRLKNK